jgi:hypothetical protein
MDGFLWSRYSAMSRADSPAVSSEVWSVLDGDMVLGTVRALPASERGVLYAVDVPWETETEDVPTPEWQAAMEYVIDQSA